MRWLRAWRMRLRALFRRQQLEDEMEAELQAHLQQQIAENLAAGMAPEAALRAARRSLGNEPLIREQAQDVWGWQWLDELGQDTRYAVRTLRKTPTFAATAIVTLALSIGAATAIFSVVDGMVLRALPFDDPDRLVAVGETVVTRPTPRLRAIAPQDFLDWRTHQTVLDHLAAFSIRTFTVLESDRPPEAVRALRVSSGFFEALRVPTVAGRTFTRADEEDPHLRVAIISYAWWQGRLGGTADVIGRTIAIDGGALEIVGIAPPGAPHVLDAETPTDLWVPLIIPPEERVRTPGRFSFYLQTVGRLRAGVTLDQAEAQLNQIAQTIKAEYPDWNADRQVAVLPLDEHLVPDAIRSWLWLLLGAVGVVVLIAYVNVGHLLLARASVRAREIGVRSALGASRWRLVRQLTAECVVLSLVAVGIGMGLAWWGVDLLRGAFPEGIPRVAAVTLDGRVFTLVAGSAALCGVVFGLVPAFEGSRPVLTHVLMDGARGATTGRVRQRVRGVLVVAEVALAVMVLIGAGLFVASFVNLMRVDLGFDPTGVLTAYVIPEPDGEMSDRASRRLGETVDRIRHVPGVATAAAVFGTSPASRGIAASTVTIPGRTLPNNGRVLTSVVTADYHRALRIALQDGRYFDDGDRDGTDPVILLSASAASELFPPGQAVGQVVEVDGAPRTIVGVVADVRPFREGQFPPTVYVPLTQFATAAGHLIIRTATDPFAMLPAVRAAVAEVLPNVPLREAASLEAVMARRTAQRRLSMLLLSVFGVLGLGIAITGVYGLLAYVVTQRTHEVGVRRALGATRLAVAGLVLRRTLWLVGAGVVLGGIGAWGARSIVGAFLFQLEPTDARVFAAAIAVVGVSALAAAMVPAQRAVRIDPIGALRHE